MKRNTEGIVFEFTGDLCESCSHVVICEVVRRLQRVVTSDLNVEVSVTVTTCEEFNEREVKE
jgi:hypothetical protein